MDNRKTVQIFMHGFLTIAVIFLFAAAATDAQCGKLSQKGYLGVSIKQLSEADKEKLDTPSGILVSGVEEDGPAEEAGILEDDVIQTYNGEKMNDPDDLVKAVRKTAPDTDVKIGLLRDGKSMEVSVKIGKLKHFTWIDNDKGKMFLKGLDSGSSVYLGVYLQDLDADLADYFAVKEDEGVLILKVSEDSPAEKAGLKSGDVIVQVKGTEVHEAKDVQEIIADCEKGEKVDLQIIRHGKNMKVACELEENPHAPKVMIKKFMHGDDPCKTFELQMNTPSSEEEFDIQVMKDIDMDQIEKQINDAMKNLEEKHIIIKKKMECSGCEA